METPNSPTGNSTPKISRPYTPSPADSDEDTDADANASTPHMEHDEQLIIYMKAHNLNIAQLAFAKPIQFKQTFDSTYGTPLDLQIHYKTQCIKITCTNPAQFQQLIDTHTFMDTLVHTELPKQPNQTGKQRLPAPSHTLTHRVIIHGVASNLTDEEVQFATNALHARRLINIQADIADSPSTSFVLSYPDTPPQLVRIGYTQYRPKLYIQRPIRCNKCQTLGHTTAKCRNTTLKCSYCTGLHNYDNCPSRHAGQPPLCANCKGDHSAAFRQCPKYVESQQALSLQATERISYRDALTQIRTTTTTSYTATTHTSHPTNAPILTPHLTPPNLPPPITSPQDQRLTELELKYEALRGALDAQAQQLQTLTDLFTSHTQLNTEQLSKLHIAVEQTLLKNAAALQLKYDELENKIIGNMKTTITHLLSNITSPHPSTAKHATPSHPQAPQPIPPHPTNTTTAPHPPQPLKPSTKTKNGKSN